jgi:hypothetical protein
MYSTLIHCLAKCQVFKADGIFGYHCVLKSQIRLYSSHNLFKFMLVLNTSCNMQQNSTYTATVHAIRNTVKCLSISEGTVGWGKMCEK